jgi:hypothetical protein
VFWIASFPQFNTRDDTSRRFDLETRKYRVKEVIQRIQQQDSVASTFDLRANMPEASEIK